MAKSLPQKVIDALQKHGLDRSACWDCHGTWVVYHWALERIASAEGITFNPPEIIEANSANKIVALRVTGDNGDRTEWSIGEAAPGNNKNAYPYAMAEKRAKDRVVLKFLNLHGLVYSEDEADDFKDTRPTTKASGDLDPEGRNKASKEDWQGPLKVTHLKAAIKELSDELNAVSDTDSFIALLFGSADCVDGTWLEICHQASVDLISWWDREDGKGAKQAIEKTAKEHGYVDIADWLNQAENPKIKQAAE